MINIIVVEDDIKDQKMIQKILKPFHFKYNETIKIEYYKKYNASLLKEIEDLSQRKIYILDICLQSKITGINIGLKIREKDWDSEIIFLTNHTSYEQKVYNSILKVFRFIEKFDHMEERLSKCIDLILSRKYDRGIFKYKNNQIDLQIYMKDILYIYRDKDERKLVIKTTNNSFLVNKSLDDILKDLDNRFKKVHRSCIANTQRISKYDWKEGKFILDTKEEVNFLSKKYKEGVV